MRGQPYTPAKLYYDGAATLEPGHFLETPAGSAYLVQTVRRSPTIRQRRYLGCVRWPPAEIPEGATVHPLHWYRRIKR